jgi:type I restriction enzyme S subunit
MGKQVKLGTFAGGKAEEAIEGEKVQGPYDLPEGWRWVKIKNIAKTISGGTPRRSVKEYWEDGTIPWVKSGELEDNIIHQTEEKITEKALRCSNVKLIPKGTLLVAMYGATVGKTAILGIDATINQAICAIFPNFTVVERDYLRYYFIYKRKELIIRSFGGAQPNISQVVIKNMVVPLPPLEEQKRIVSRLEQLVNRAEEVRRLRKQAREEAEKIMQAALNKVFSRVEEEGWERAELGEVCEINPAKHEIKNLPDNMQVTFVPMSAVSEVTGKIERPEIRLLGEVRKGYTYFKEGDVLFAKITPCMENGKSAIARGLINGIGFGSTEFHVLRPSSKVHAEWIHFYIRQKSFRDKAAKNMTGSVGQQRVPVEFLRKVMIPLPSLEKQKKMIDYLDKISEIIESLKKLQQRTEEELEKLVPSILDKAFKGEL